MHRATAYTASSRCHAPGSAPSHLYFRPLTNHPLQQSRSPFSTNLITTAVTDQGPFPLQGREASATRHSTKFIIDPTWRRSQLCHLQAPLYLQGQQGPKKSVEMIKGKINSLLHPCFAKVKGTATGKAILCLSRS